MRKNELILFFILICIVKKFSFAQFDPVKLPETVNASASELLPLITPDGNTLYFIRQQNDMDPTSTWFGTSTQKIWYSTKDASGHWQQAVKMADPFNKGRFSGVCSITPDGNTIMILGVYRNNYFYPSERGFSVSHRNAAGWSYPQQMNIEGFKDMDKGTEKNAFLLNDGNTLIICLSEESGSNQLDIYVSFKTGDNNWSRPQKFPANINTTHTEEAAYVASDEVTMYFSSDRDTKPDANDIYMTRRLDDTWMNWSEPMNIGKPINTSKYDSYLSFDACGDSVYFVQQGKLALLGSDIFKTQLAEQYRPYPVVTVEGIVSDDVTKKPLVAALTYFDLESGKQLGTAATDPTTGRYYIALPLGKNYGYRATCDGHVSQSGAVDLTQADKCNHLKSDLVLSTLTKGSTIRLNNIFFQTGSAKLLPESNIELDHLVELLNEHTTMKIQINGHTDSQGDDVSNQKLSTDRAKAVYDYLVAKGIATSRLKSAGYGETKPVASNDTDEGRALNRRVEFTILSL